MRTAAPAVHHVVVEVAAGVGGELESLVHASSGDDGVGGGDRRNDVLDHPLGALHVHTFDVELLRSLQGCFVHPFEVQRIIHIRLLRC